MELGVSVESVDGASCSAATATTWCRSAATAPSAASRSRSSSRPSASTRSRSARARPAARSSRCSRPARPSTRRRRPRSRWPRPTSTTRSASCRARRCLEGEYGVHGFYVGVPVLIGAGGVETVIEVELTDEGEEGVRGLRRATSRSWSTRWTRFSRAEAVNIHEYQAKEILRQVRRDRAARQACATPPAEARGRTRARHGTCVVKAQIHAGGRGKGGGVKVVPSRPRRRAEFAAGLLGMPLRHAPDRARGPASCASVLVEERLRHRPRALPRPRRRSRQSAGHR